MISDLSFPITAWIRAPEAGIRARGSWRRWVDLPVRVARFRHARHGLCQIDTGYTPALTAPGRSVAVRAYAAAFRPRLVAGAGAPRLDHLILSHFHADHACGVRDFLPAQIWGDPQAMAAWRCKSAVSRVRHGVFTSLFDGVEVGQMNEDLFGDGSLRVVPLPGHQSPHYGFEFPGLGLLYAVDAAFTLAGGGFLPHLVGQDRRADAQTRAVLAAYPGRVVLCHDPAPQPEDC